MQASLQPTTPQARHAASPAMLCMYKVHVDHAAHQPQILDAMCAWPRGHTHEHTHTHTNRRPLAGRLNTLREHRHYTVQVRSMTEIVSTLQGQHTAETKPQTQNEQPLKHQRATEARHEFQPGRNRQLAAASLQQMTGAALPWANQRACNLRSMPHCTCMHTQQAAGQPSSGGRKLHAAAHRQTATGQLTPLGSI